MKQFYISCKESRIENNKSFYGSFSLGPFEGGQSLTIANALRRTLLSELKGLAIVSIQIEGVLHEYSSIPGVKDSVLDILLNLKEIHFTNSCISVPNNLAMLPQIGYLQVRGPGVIRSSDLKLPPFIKLVDPDQYIATLAEDGFLNMKFIIAEGTNYIIGNNKGLAKQDLDPVKVKSQTLGSFSTSTEVKTNASLLSQEKKNKTALFNNNNSVNFNLRRSLLQKMGLTLSLENQKTISGSVIYNLKKRFLNLKKHNIGFATKLPQNLPNSNSLIIDAVFAPVTKVNYMIEYSEHKKIDTSFSNATQINDLFNFLKPLSSVNELENRTNQSFLKENFENLPILKENLKQKNIKSLLSDILLIKNQLTSIPLSNNYVKPSTIKHNIIIEIWTNGSMHPRDALYQGLKHLVNVFSSLYQLDPFKEEINSNQLNNLVSDTKLFSSGFFFKNYFLLKQSFNRKSNELIYKGPKPPYKVIKEKIKGKVTLKNLNKGIKRKPNTSVTPLNKTVFSSNYTVLTKTTIVN